jgi:hypothetical protein
MADNLHGVSGTPEKASQRTLPFLGWILAVLVVVHFTIAVAIPVIFVLEVRGIAPDVVERVFSIWLAHPVIITLCLTLARRSAAAYRPLLIVDIAISVVQVASVFVLYSCYS